MSAKGTSMAMSLATRGNERTIDRSDGERARRVDGEGARKTIAIGLGIRTATIDPKGGLVKRHLVLMSGGPGMTSPRIDEGEMKKKTNVSTAQKKGMTKRTCDMERMFTSNGLTATKRQERNHRKGE